jgi:hypothetical protein
MFAKDVGMDMLRVDYQPLAEQGAEALIEAMKSVRKSSLEKPENELPMEIRKHVSSFEIINTD